MKQSQQTIRTKYEGNYRSHKPMSFVFAKDPECSQTQSEFRYDKPENPPAQSES